MIGFELSLAWHGPVLLVSSRRGGSERHVAGFIPVGGSYFFKKKKKKKLTPVYNDFRDR